MRLLIVTQTVDKTDPVLGFFHTWIEEFARRVESIHVICLYEGAHSFPENVVVHTLGKESAEAPSPVYAWRFLSLAWGLRNQYDAVFVHMNPEYLILGGPLWVWCKKKRALWYMHKAVSWRLRLGIVFAQTVFTGSKLSMRVKTRKKNVVGHGIDATNIHETPPPPYPPLELLSIGRISRVKNTHIFLETLSSLRANGIDARLTVVGSPVTKDGNQYFEELKGLAEGLGVTESVRFVGPVPHTMLTHFFESTHLFLHASATGSLDKASLEPLLAGVPIVTVNTELCEAACKGIILCTADPEEFAGAIRKAIGLRLWDDDAVRSELRHYVLQHHELTRLVSRILDTMNP
jgi:glycosyltransferase involved in cell wall biosynthesis